MAIWLYGKKNKKLTIKDIKENIRKNLYELICLIYGKRNRKLTIKDIKENIRQIFFYIFTLLNNS